MGRPGGRAGWLAPRRDLLVLTSRTCGACAERIVRGVGSGCRARAVRSACKARARRVQSWFGAGVAWVRCVTAMKSCRSASSHANRWATSGCSMSTSASKKTALSYGARASSSGFSSQP